MTYIYHNGNQEPTTQTGGFAKLLEELRSGDCMVVERLSGAAKDSAALLALLDDLEARGILTRRFAPDDRRSCHLTLTEQGAEIAEAGAERQRQFFETLYAGISLEEREQMRAICLKIMENISRF